MSLMTRRWSLSVMNTRFQFVPSSYTATVPVREILICVAIWFVFLSKLKVRRAAEHGESSPIVRRCVTERSIIDQSYLGLAKRGRRRMVLFAAQLMKTDHQFAGRARIYRPLARNDQR